MRDLLGFRGLICLWAIGRYADAVNMFDFFSIAILSLFWRKTACNTFHIWKISNAVGPIPISWLSNRRS